MNIHKQLILVQNNADRDKIAKYIGHNPIRFEELMNILFREDEKFVQYAFLTLNRVLDKYPDLILPYLERLVNIIEREKPHVSHKRNIMRALQGVDVPEELCGRVLDLAMTYLYDQNEAIAVKAFSMEVAFNLSKTYPELLEEIKLIITELLPHGTPGIISRGNKILSKINKLL